MKHQKTRRFSSSILGLLIMFSTLTVLNIASMSALGEYHDQNWEINDCQWRDNVDITLDQCDLIIKNGGTLRFNDSVNLEIICDEPGDNGIKIETGGRFEIYSPSHNTKISFGSEDPSDTYWFINYGTIDFLGATVERVYGNPNLKGSTGGIRNLAGSICNMTSCSILDADTHSLCIEGNCSNPVMFNFKSSNIYNTTSGRLNGTGINIEGNSDIVIDAAKVKNTTDEGIKCLNVDNVSIRNGTEISLIKSHGIYLDSAEVVIEDCSLNNITGDNDIPGNAIHVVDSLATIDNNKIKDIIYDGIYLHNSDNSIVTNNIIESHLNTSVASGICLEISSNITVKNNDISGKYGISLSGQSNYNIIENNNVMSSADSIERGLRFNITHYSINNTISNNNVNNTGCSGIWAQKMNNTIISNNVIMAGANDMVLANVYNNEIHNNTLISTPSGIIITGSSNNEIIHNNFINITNPASDYGTNNSWDKGYPCGGNYWNDYNGTDLSYGTGQSYSGSDGIGDCVYNSTYGKGISGTANSVDNYPLFRPLSKKTWRFYNGWNYRTFTAEVTGGWDSSDLTEDIIDYLNSTYDQSLQNTDITIHKYNPTNDTLTTCWYDQSASAWVNVFNVTEGEAYNITFSSGILSEDSLLYELPNEAIVNPVSVELYNGETFVGFPITSIKTASELALDIIDYMEENYEESISKTKIKIKKYDSESGSFKTCWYVNSQKYWVNDFDLVAEDGYYIELIRSPLSTSPRAYIPPV